MRLPAWFGLRAIFVVLLAATWLAAPFPIRAETPDVHGRIVAPASLAAGAKTTLIVEMSLGKNWHVNSHTPAERFLVPTDVRLTATTGTLSGVRYPPHVEKRFAFSEKPLMVYEGTVRFEVDLALGPDASGEDTVAGAIAYQACNDRQCFPPAKISLKQIIAITPAGGAGSAR